MLKRFLTAAILIPIGASLAFINIFNGLFMFAAVLSVSIILVYEIGTMVSKNGYRIYIWLVSVSVSISHLLFYLYGLGQFNLGTLFLALIVQMIFFFMVVFTVESLAGNFERSVEHMAIAGLTYILAGVFMPFITLLKTQDPTGWTLAIPLLIAWIADAGGLLAGKFFGKHKLRMLSSPNKTMEGYIGALLFGLVTGVLIYAAQRLFALPTRFSLFQMAILTVSVILASMIGDLGESTIKRWANTKDSGDLLPGHGGIFDRFDSILLSVPLFYALIKLFGY